MHGTQWGLSTYNHPVGRLLEGSPSYRVYDSGLSPGMASAWMRTTAETWSTCCDPPKIWQWSHVRTMQRVAFKHRVSDSLAEIPCAIAQYKPSRLWPFVKEARHPASRLSCARPRRTDAARDRSTNWFRSQCQPYHTRCGFERGAYCLEARKEERLVHLALDLEWRVHLCINSGPFRGWRSSICATHLRMTSNLVTMAFIFRCHRAWLLNLCKWTPRFSAVTTRACERGRP